MRLINYLVLFCLISVSHSAFAEETKAKDSEEPAPVNKKFEEIKEITDAKMKADSGSLSRFSLRANLTYYGPPIGDLSALDQPNPDGTVSSTATAISGSMGLRYRFNSSNSLSLYAGVSDDFPFRSQQKLDANNPSITWDRAFKLWGIQMLSSPGITIVTARAYKKVAEWSGANWGLSTMYVVPDSKFAFGADVGISTWFFRRPWLHSDGKVRRINLAALPVIKYNFTDRLNLNTSFSIAYYNPRSDQGDMVSLYKRTVNEKITLGYALSRDVYIAPYIQFYPAQLTLRSTTFNISSSFSIF